LSDKGKGSSEMTAWEWMLLGVAGYVALTTLVTLMRRRRDALVDELSWQADLERRRKQIEKVKEERRKLMEKFNRQAS
jgi:hypothetical protein